MANLTVVDGKGYFDADAKVNSVWIDGRFYRLPVEADKDKSESNGKKNASAKPDKKKEKKKKADEEKKLAKQKELEKRVARSPLDGRGVLAAPPMVLVRNATIWTCGPTRCPDQRRSAHRTWQNKIRRRQRWRWSGRRHCH